MGWPFEVHVWTDRSGRLQYERYWEGRSAIQCILQAIKAKREGFGCVKVEWRGVP